MKPGVCSDFVCSLTDFTFLRKVSRDFDGHVLVVKLFLSQPRQQTNPFDLSLWMCLKGGKTRQLRCQGLAAMTLVWIARHKDSDNSKAVHALTFGTSHYNRC